MHPQAMIAFFAVLVCFGHVIETTAVHASDNSVGTSHSAVSAEVEADASMKSSMLVRREGSRASIPNLPESSVKVPNSLRFPAELAKTSRTTTFYFTHVASKKFCKNAHVGYKKNVGSYQMQACFDFVRKDPNCGVYFDFEAYSGLCDCVPASAGKCDQGDAEHTNVYLIQKGGPEALLENPDEGFQSTHGNEMISSYEDFRSKYRRSQDGADTVDYATRLALFEARRAAAEAHNSQGRTWKAGINQFADYTTEEFASLLGYKRHARSKGWQSWQDASFLQVQEHGHGKVIAEAVDWLQNVTVSRHYTHDQGSCGSCWAVATALALEMHAEITHHHTVPLSFEQLVDCVDNPDHCGGDGGCKGATAELAFHHVKKSGGIVAADAYKGGYLSSKEGKCKPPTPDASIVRVADFKRLETNRLQPLREAVATRGPVVVSVDATNWGSYSSGVFDGCTPDATVNHAVTLIGYGHDSEHKKDYWLIRNSWGSDWGEDGSIRLLRHSSDRGEAGYCGTDKEPEQGNGCRGGPKEIEVCGMCGVLSDSVYPIGVTLSKASEAQQTVQPHH